MRATETYKDGTAPRFAGRFHLLRALSTMIKEGGAALRREEKKNFSVLRFVGAGSVF